MDDAIRATLQIMEAPAKNIKERSSYNLAAMSFTPKEMAENIKAVIPEFKIGYKPDFRQAIADSWPSSIDDSKAQKDWKWKAEFDLQKTTETMLENLKNRV